MASNYKESLKRDLVALTEDGVTSAPANKCQKQEPEELMILEKKVLKKRERKKQRRRDRKRMHNYSMLPWYQFPPVACFVCKKKVKDQSWIQHCAEHETGRTERLTSEDMIRWPYLMNGFLLNVCYSLKLRNVDELLEFARKHASVKMCLRPYDFNLMRFYEKVNGLKETQSYNVTPPNCVAALTKGDILIPIIENMSSEVYKRLILNDKMCDLSGKIILDPTRINIPGVMTGCPQAADACLHMDRLFLRTRRTDYKSATTRLTDGRRSVWLDFSVASFCLPDSWPKGNAREELQSDRQIKLAIGWSPTVMDVPDDNMLRNFAEQLRMPGVVAAGELGLNYSADITAEERQIQLEILKLLLPVVYRSCLPVIITCKQAKIEGSPSFNAMEDCINTMREILPGYYSIYLTGFNGDLGAYKAWTSDFHNVKFGISPVILDKDRMNEQLVDVIEKMPENQILLETKAPVFTPKKYVFAGGLVAHQDLLVDVAEKVANIKFSHRAIIIDMARKNLQEFLRKVIVNIN